MLEVRLLGQFDVRRDGTPIGIPSRAAQSLFGYLLLTAGTAHRREKLAGLLWPDMTDENARKNLRHELWRLRNAVETKTPDIKSASHLVVDEISIAFDTESDYWLDAAIVQRPLPKHASAEQLMEMLSLYRGELLPGLYDDWIMLERERVHAAFEQKMARLLELLVEENRWHEALDWGERWIALGQTPEPAYRALMVAHCALGNASQVASVYQRCVSALRNDLGIEASEQTRALFERLSKNEKTPEIVSPDAPSLPRQQTIKTAVTAQRRIKSPPSASLAPLPNLPVPLTSFIGRHKELEEIARQLASSRLLTLTGPGGVGKTRTAIQTAHNAIEEFKDGVWWVDLAPLMDSTLVPQAVAHVLGVRETLGQPLTESLKSFLREKRLLLVLDNCEHLITACAHLADDLLTQCANLRILATSREALSITGERVYQVPTLSLPESQRLDADSLMEYEGTHLFVERAVAVKSDWTFTEQNATAVLQICRRLDGIPLAIELAAARVKLLTVENIAGRLDNRFNLLTQGSRTALPRQQTLRATVDWSYDLLLEEARLLFRRLSVFAGGFSMEAAEGICAEGPLTPGAVFDLLARLIDRSLVSVERQGDTSRYRMLETIHEYALERVRASGEFERLRDRHLSYFLQSVEQIEPELKRGNRTELDKMEAENDNIRAALDWSLNRKEQLTAALRLAGATYWFWDVRGLWSEARRWLETLLARAAPAPTPVRAKLQLLLAATIFKQSGPGKARALTEESLAMWRELRDKWWISFALYQLGWVDLYDRNLDAAGFHFEECVSLARELDDDFLLARGLHSLGGVLRRAHSASAVPVLEEGLSIAQRSGDKSIMVAQLYHLGLAESSRGNIAGASKRYEDGLALARELGDRSATAEILARLAVDVILPQDDVAKAEAFIWEGLEMSVALGNHAEIAFDLAWLGYVAAAREEFQRSAQLLSASNALFEKLGLSMSVWPDRGRVYDQYVSHIRAQLDETAFTKSWAEGRTMTMEQAVAFALSELEDSKSI